MSCILFEFETNNILPNHLSYSNLCQNFRHLVLTTEIKHFASRLFGKIYICSTKGPIQLEQRLDVLHDIQLLMYILMMMMIIHTSPLEYGLTTGIW